MFRLEKKCWPQVWIRFRVIANGPSQTRGSTFNFLPPWGKRFKSTLIYLDTVPLTLINTAPFGTLITPGVVPIMLHTLLCLLGRQSVKEALC